MNANELSLGTDASGAHGHYFLDGKPVHPGEVLELRLDDGTWFPIRFEIKHNGGPIGCWELPSGHPAIVPLDGCSVLRRPTD